MAEKQGVDLTAMNRLLCDKLFGGAIYQRLWFTRAFTPAPAGRVSTAAGSERYALTRGMADAARVPMPMADMVFNRLLSQVAKGRGDLHWTGLAIGAREDAGLPA